MRLRKPGDTERLASMLSKEGLLAEEMVFAECPTVVMETGGRVEGFFTLRKEHRIPYIVHLCGEPGTGWALVKTLKSLLQSMGARKAILNVPSAKKKLLRVVQRVLRATPYGESNGHTFLTMEV